jgi:hypothetical protein
MCLQYGGDATENEEKEATLVRFLHYCTLLDRVRVSTTHCKCCLLLFQASSNTKDDSSKESKFPFLEARMFNEVSNH